MHSWYHGHAAAAALDAGPGRWYHEVARRAVGPGIFPVFGTKKAVSAWYQGVFRRFGGF